MIETLDRQMTLDEMLDRPRLGALAESVLSVMSDGRWRTLGEIRGAVCRGSEAGISARIRELHSKHGFDYEKRRRGLAEQGLWEYRFV